MISRVKKVVFHLLFVQISVSGFAQEETNARPLSEKIDYFYMNPDPQIAKENH